MHVRKGNVSSMHVVGLSRFVHSFLEVLGGVTVFYELHRRLCQLCGWENSQTSKFSWQFVTDYCPLWMSGSCLFYI